MRGGHLLIDDERGADREIGRGIDPGKGILRDQEERREQEGGMVGGRGSRVVDRMSALDWEIVIIIKREGGRGRGRSLMARRYNAWSKREGKGLL